MYPTCHTSKIRHRKHNTEGQVSRSRERGKKPAPTYFCNPRSTLHYLSATPFRAPLRSIVFLQLPLTAPLRYTRFSVRYAPRSAPALKFRISRTNGGQSNLRPLLRNPPRKLPNSVKLRSR